MELEHIEPETAVELYLADRKAELRQATLNSHRSRLQFLVEWCENCDIENLNELTGRKLQEYRLWRRNDGDLAPASENCQMDTVRVFVRWLESIDGAPQDLHQKVRSPTVGADEGSREDILESEDAGTILEYLETYEYASVEHVALTLLWRTMLRRGAVHALDVEDYRPEERCLEVVHRPETGTPIKNGHRGNVSSRSRERPATSLAAGSATSVGT
jgi:site-specific recombinase XerD